jgi:pantoate--beta-alanine ligase
VQTGVVMVIYLEEAVARKIAATGRLTRERLHEAVMEGALLRLRPKFMTVATVVASLLPIMWSTRTGAEVMKPLATPVLGGMISSLIHVLIVTLDGRFRPGHFRGVATVVLKLLNTTLPTRAYFGEKDYQQLALLRRMAADLDLGVSVVGCATVREADGLALSSRNVYLSPAERGKAPAIHEGLRLAAGVVSGGGSTKAALAAAVRHVARAIPDAVIDYVELVDAETLAEVKAPRGRMRLLAAVRLGKTRLIDNIPVSL